MDGTSRGADDAPPDPDLLVCFNGQHFICYAADGEFVIGREVPPSNIQIDHPAISRLHIRLVPGTRWELVDFDSRNGVYLHGQRIRHDVVLSDAMTVHLGAPDGIPVTFCHLALIPGNPPSPATAAGPDVARTGRAVTQRCDELGISPHVIGRAILDGLSGGHLWPDEATRTALETVLTWPVGTLDAIRGGQAPGEITDVITPAVRRSLLVDSATLALADIDTEINALPPATNPQFSQRAQPLQHRLAQLEETLTAAARAGGFEVDDVLGAIAIYRRIVDPAALRA